MRAAILARVSTPGQAAADRHSLAAQRAAMLRLAEREGWEVVRVYEIPGESAYTDEIARRPEFDAALRAGEAGEFDALIVDEFTRFARDQYLAHASMRRLRKAGILLYNSSGSEYTGDPLRAGVEAALAQEQSARHSYKVRAAFDERARRGLPTGDIPFGYQRGASTDVPPVVVEAEAEAVRWAFRAYAAGTGHVAIAEEFNRRGLRPHSKRGYSGFVASSVQRILESRFYLGMISHRGEERQGAHAAIVSLAEWQAAAARTRRFRRTAHETTLLTGLASCASCGGPIWTSGWDRRRTDRYYREPSHQQLRECANARTQWRSSEPDGQVAAVLRSLGGDREWLDYCERQSRRLPKPAPGLREELAGQRERATTAFIRGVLPEAEWQRTVAEIDARLRSIPAVPSVVLAARRSLASFEEVWEMASMGRRRELVRMVFASVALDTRARAVVLHPHPEYEPLFGLRALFAGSTPDRSGGRLQHTGYTLPDLGVVA